MLVAWVLAPSPCLVGLVEEIVELEVEEGDPLVERQRLVVHSHYPLS
jgi:hypothetical protein